MSCTGPTGPICSPPVPVTTVVAGPQGPTGPTGAQGLIGPTGPAATGATGPTGPLGPIGLKGATGSSGVQGATGAMSMIAFFSGSIWAPTYPYDRIFQGLRDGLVLDFGAVPMATGDYIIDFDLQMAWSGYPDGNLARDSDLFIWDGVVAERARLHWSFEKINKAAEAVRYGNIFNYGHKLKITLTQGQHLKFIAGGGWYLVGGQCAAYVLPPYVVTSPGFTNGTPGP